MNNLPFIVAQDTDLERWRAETWATKEPETIAWIKSFPPDAAFYDIGANIGIYSLFCATFHPKSTVYAFEPCSYNWFPLMRNILKNDLHNVFPLMLAVGNDWKFINFKIRSTVSGASGGQMGDPITENGEPFDAVTTELVFQTSLDWFVIREVPVYAHYPVFMPTHIKIDIDGLEMQVIEGMRLVLQLPELRSILIEINPLTDKDAINAIFREHGLLPDVRFNEMTPHSRERRQREGIKAENVIYSR